MLQSVQFTQGQKRNEPNQVDQDSSAQTISQPRRSH